MIAKRLLPCILLILCTITACKKHKNKPIDSNGLPPATQTGANTFGCLVNGEVFVPKRKFGGLNPILTCYYEYIYSGSPSGYVFQVAGSDNSKPGLPTEVTASFDSLTLEYPKSYKLQEPVRGKAYGQYIKFTNGLIDFYYTYSPSSGELTITRFDEENQIVSGTFWFTAVNDKGDTVKVTDGRFDMQYTQ